MPAVFLLHYKANEKINLSESKKDSKQVLSLSIHPDVGEERIDFIAQIPLDVNNKVPHQTIFKLKVNKKITPW
jgi:hypothetical protein